MVVRSLLAALFFGMLAGTVHSEPGPRDRECMVGEQRINGECQPITRGPQNKGSGGADR